MNDHFCAREENNRTIWLWQMLVLASRRFYMIFPLFKPFNRRLVICEPILKNHYNKTLMLFRVRARSHCGGGAGAQVKRQQKNRRHNENTTTNDNNNIIDKIMNNLHIKPSTQLHNVCDIYMYYIALFVHIFFLRRQYRAICTAIILPSVVQILLLLN